VPGTGITGSGTTASPSEQVTVLQTFGVLAHQESASLANLAQAVAERRGVMASLDAAFIWVGNTPVGSFHTVLVTGVQYDRNGNLIFVFVNDTGQIPVAAGGPGNCGLFYWAPNFQTAMNAVSYPGGNLVVTNNRVF
jgi:hypothetical protein